MAPHARGGECVIVSCSVEYFSEEIVGELYKLVKAIENFPNFEIDPTVLCETTEVVSVNKFFKDTGESDMCIFTTIERSSQVKVFYVKGNKLGASSRKNTVDKDFNKFQGTRGSAIIARVENEVASNSDADAIGSLFLWSDFTNHFGVCDYLSLVNMDVLVANHNKFVSSCNALACTSRVSTNALTESSKFIGI